MGTFKIINQDLTVNDQSFRISIMGRIDKIKDRYVNILVQELIILFLYFLFWNYLTISGAKFARVHWKEKIEA